LASSFAPLTAPVPLATAGHTSVTQPRAFPADSAWEFPEKSELLLFDVLPGIPTALRQKANPGCSICSCATTPRTRREN